MSVIKAQKNWKKANKVLDGVKKGGNDIFNGSKSKTRGPQARHRNTEAKESRNLEKLHKQHRRAAASPLDRRPCRIRASRRPRDAAAAR